MKASRITGLLVLALIIAMPVGCTPTGKDDKSSSASVSLSYSNQSDSSSDESTSKHESSGSEESSSKPQASGENDNYAPANVVYEGIFLDNEQIDSYFRQVRGEAPFGNITKDFHVTTLFFPEKDSRALYGKEIEVHIIGYKAAEVKTENGGTTSNEGFKVELKSDDNEMTSYLVRNDRSFHITGAYMDNPGYTVNIDFSDSQPLDFTVIGTFGAYLDNDTILVSRDDADKILK